MLSLTKIRIKSFIIHIYGLCLDFWWVIGISTLIFLICRYVGNIINIFYTVLGLDLDYIGLIRVDRIYDYRYTFSLYVFIILFILKSYMIIKKPAYRSHVIIKKFVYRIHTIIKKLEDILVHKKDRDLLLFLFAITAAVRLIAFFTIISYGEGPILRMAVAQGVAMGVRSVPSLPFLVPSLIWPPLHSWIVAAVYSIVGDIFTASRLVSLVFGVFSIFPFYYLIKGLAGRRAAFFSSLFFSVYGPHVFFSTLPLAEAPAIFFILLGFLFFFRHLINSRSGGKREILLSAIILNVATMLRVEFFVVVIPLFFILLFKRWKNALLFGSLASAFLLFWICLEYKVTGNAFYSFTTLAFPLQLFSLESLTLFGLELTGTVFGRVLQFGLLIKSHITILVLLIASLGLAYSLIQKKMRVYAVAFLVVSLIYSSLAVVMSIAFLDRHMLMMGVLFLPFIYRGCEALGRLVTKFYRNPALKAEVCTLLILLVAVASFAHASSVRLRQYKQEIDTETLDDSVFQTINWLERNTLDNITLLVGIVGIPVRDAIVQGETLMMTALRNAYKGTDAQLVTLHSNPPNISMVAKLIDRKEPPYRKGHITKSQNFRKKFPLNSLNFAKEKEAYDYYTYEIPMQENSLYFIAMLSNDSSFLELTADCRDETADNYTFKCVFESPKSKTEVIEDNALVATEIFFRVYKVERPLEH